MIKMVLMSQLDLSSKIYFVVKQGKNYAVIESQVAEVSFSSIGVKYFTKIGKVIKSNMKNMPQGTQSGPFEFSEKQLDEGLYKDGCWPVFSCKDTAKEFLHRKE